MEELSEGYAGFWALNRLSRPVRVEADLDAHTRRVLWAGAHTVLSSWHWRDLFRMSSERRDQLLTLSPSQSSRGGHGRCYTLRGRATELRILNLPPCTP